MDVDPLSVIFVKSDSKGDRLLFRYPFFTEQKVETKRKLKKQNPYALNVTEDLLQTPRLQTSNVLKGQLAGFTDEVLATLFAVKPELCNQKFELKVNDVRFVGHPTLLPYRCNKDDNSSMMLINIVFALRASASHSIVKCYYDLSKRFGLALWHEEKRCAYLSEETKIMIMAHDEIASVESEDDSGCGDEGSLHGLPIYGGKSVFQVVLERSGLARSMKDVFDQLCNTGLVHTRINKWALISFCVPHKAHQLHNSKLIVEPETIDRCLANLRPYHGMLLLVDPNELLASIPLAGSTSLIRLVKTYSPLKSLQTLAIEADLLLSQVYQLVGHLVYWAKATIIYPLCESNVYVVSPSAEVYTDSPLVTEFAKEFPGLCLLQMLAEFSLPAPLWYHARCGRAAARLPRTIAWMLQHRLLLQLHTYVHIDLYNVGKEYFCEKHNFTKPSDITQVDGFQVNIPAPIETRSCSRGHYLDSEDSYPTKNNLNQINFLHTKPLEIGANANKIDSANHSLEEAFDTVDGYLKAKLLEHNIDFEDSNIDIIDDSCNNPNTPSPKGIKDIESSFGKDTCDINIELADDIEINSIKELEVSLTKKDSGRSVDSGLGNLINQLKLTDSDSDKSADSDEADALIRRRVAEPVAIKIPGAETKREETGFDLCGEPSCIAPRLSKHRALLSRLHHRGYLKGDKHLEEIMFMENLTRSQVIQLLDKFRDILITFETEDPTVAMLYPRY